LEELTVLHLLRWISTFAFLAVTVPAALVGQGFAHMKNGQEHPVAVRFVKSPYAAYLDTGYQRHLAHRAYLGNGFHIDCHHMAWPVRPLVDLQP
jgi:hypothetical protein